MTDYVYGVFCPSLKVCALARTVLVKMSNITGTVCIATIWLGTQRFLPTRNVYCVPYNELLIPSTLKLK